MRFRLADRISLGIGCILMAIVYFCVHGSYGFDLFSQGYIEAQAWRVYNGQTPYIDFSFSFPPLSLYLHSLLSHTSYPIYWERFLFYLLISLSVLFTTRSFQAFFDFRSLGVSPLIFSFIGFIFSIHNFPPSASATVDGIFFSTMGIYLFTKIPHGYFYGLLGLLSILCAALCHQLFWPVLLFAPFMLYFLFPGKKSNWAISLFLTIMSLILFAFWVFDREFIIYAWQSVAFFSPHEIWERGLKPYLFPALIWVLPLVAIWLIKMNYTLVGFWRDLPSLIYWIFFFGLLGAHVAKVLQTSAYVSPSFGFGQALFLIAIGVSIRTTWLEPKASLLLLGMLTLSWCVSLDANYPHHFLYISPILFCFFRGLCKELDFRLPRYFYGVAFFVMYCMFALWYQFPYEDATRSKDNYDLGNVYPKMFGIFSGDYMNSQAKEILILTQDYPQPAVFIPSFPTFHLLQDSISLTPFDDLRYPAESPCWPRDSIQKVLKQNYKYIFVDKEHLAKGISPDNDWLFQYIQNECLLIEDGDRVDVYSW